MAGPGMELIGEEEVEEVLGVLRAGYLYRYGISLGDGGRFRVSRAEGLPAGAAGGRAFARALLRFAVNSGTSALLSAMVGARHRPGGTR